MCSSPFYGNNCEFQYISFYLQLKLCSQGVFYLGVFLSVVSVLVVTFFFIFTPKLLIKTKFNVKESFFMLIEQYQHLLIRQYIKIRLQYFVVMQILPMFFTLVYMFYFKNYLQQMLKIVVQILIIVNNFIPLLFQKYTIFQNQFFCYLQTISTLIFNISLINIYTIMNLFLYDVSFTSKLTFSFQSVYYFIILITYLIIDSIRFMVDKQILPNLLDIPFEFNYYNKDEELEILINTLKLQLVELNFQNIDEFI